jgi:hypothetical protein
MHRLCRRHVLCDHWRYSILYLRKLFVELALSEWKQRLEGVSLQPRVHGSKRRGVLGVHCGVV